MKKKFVGNVVLPTCLYVGYRLFNCCWEKFSVESCFERFIIKPIGRAVLCGGAENRSCGEGGASGKVGCIGT